MLEYKDVTYRQINVWDLDKYFEKVYGVDPQIVSAEVWQNDTYYLFVADGKMTGDDIYQSAKLVAGQYVQFDVCHLVLQTLVIAGHLDPGTYLIQTWW